MGTLRSRFTFASGSIVLSLLGLLHCGGTDGSLFNENAGCPTELADRCGAQCTVDSDCADGVFCGGAGVCTAECASGTRCSNGVACSPRGRCTSDPGSGLNSSPIDGDDGGGGPDAVCAETEVALTRLIPKVLFLLDQSSSMWNYKFPGDDVSNGCAAGCRWKTLQDVLIGPNLATGGLIKQLEGEAELGMQMYSATDKKQGDGDDSYLPAAAGAVDTCPRFNGKAFAGTTFALNNAAAIDGALRNAGVDDDTPTGPAVRAVCGLANNGTISDPKGFASVAGPAPKVIVLVTDGEPGNCGDNYTSAGAQADVVAAVEQAYKHQIKTFVIAIGDQSAHFTAVANAGQGKNPATGDAKAITPATRQQLVDALKKVVLDARQCTFELNGRIPAGQEKSGTVTLNGAPVPYDDPGAPDEGWRVVGESKIELVGSACETIKNSPNAQLSARFPCGVVMPNGPR